MAPAILHFSENSAFISATVGKEQRLQHANIISEVAQLTFLLFSALGFLDYTEIMSLPIWNLREKFLVYLECYLT